MITPREKIKLLRLYNKVSDLLAKVYYNYNVSIYKFTSGPIDGILIRNITTGREFNHMDLFTDFHNNIQNHIPYDARDIYDKAIHIQESIEKDNYSMNSTLFHKEILKNMKSYINRFEEFFTDVQKYPKIT